MELDKIEIECLLITNDNLMLIIIEPVTLLEAIAESVAITPESNVQFPPTVSFPPLVRLFLPIFT